MKNYILLFFFWNCFFTACKAQLNPNLTEETENSIVVGAAKFDSYLPMLENKKVGLVVNQTSIVGQTHLADTLLSLGVKVEKIYAPEHGFRGTADAGEKIKDGVDTKTGLKVVSLYGSNRKPKAEDIAGIDILIFDIQDVGARFYTYISTLHYVMEAAAENNKMVVVLDRPNPNGHYVAGNVLDLKFKSFVGMHPIPIVHGMTVGEYAQMINGEKWLEGGIKCKLQVVSCDNYTHATPYDLPVKPSPNLPNSRAIALYPSICFFEGTQISVGRGTAFPFQAIGAPKIDKALSNFYFQPKSMEGAKNPPHINKLCFGFDLRENNPPFNFQENDINLDYLITMYNLYEDKQNFFLENNFINLLAGTDQLKKDIMDGLSAAEIKAKWQPALENFKKTRKQYLLYKDFE